MFARLGVLVLALTGLARAAAGSTASAEPDPLSSIGAKLDEIRFGSPADAAAGLGRLAENLSALMEAGIDDARLGAARFLAGEIAYERGEFSRAAEWFRKIEREDGVLADDAALAAIASLEADGRDEEAANAWKRWEKHHAPSALAPEVYLAQAWNALRRGRVPEASRILAELNGRFPWMVGDRRAALASALLEYVEGRPQAAIESLAGAGTDAPATYLRALSQEAIGAPLQAAALYQEIVERHPDSRLRDHAMLAKANVFLRSGAYRSAAEEFARVAEEAQDGSIRAEGDLRRAVSIFLDGDATAGSMLLHDVVTRHARTDVAARAQFLLGEMLYEQKQFEEAITEYNRVLTNYFEHSLAAGAQYRVGRCLDAVGRHRDATSTYQTVVSGYSQSREAPAAAYLAGLGLLNGGQPLAAADYFQIVLDRYAIVNAGGELTFASPEQRELVEAALCLLELSYHRAGDLGQLSGAPHLLLQRMPASDSPWRAFALLIDADALASQARFDDARAILERLLEESADAELAVPATRLLAWIYSQQGQHDLAIDTERDMLRRYGSETSQANLGSAYLNQAHLQFNRKQYAEAAATYEDFLRDYPSHPGRELALYQGGICYMRLKRAGDAVDRWEALVAENPASKTAEKAWLRAADAYFQAEQYDSAKRCYEALIANFVSSPASRPALLRLAQCDYNGGRDEDALAGFSNVIATYPGTPVAEEAQRGIEMALYRLGQREDSSEILASLVERYPTSQFAADAQFKIASGLYDAERYGEAAEAFRRLVTQFPGHPEAPRAHYLMADAYEKSGAVREARAGYEQFLVFFPESDLRLTVRFRLATLRFQEADYMRAAVDFTSVLESQPSDELTVASLFNLALCHRMLGALDEARAAFEQLRAEHDVDAERAAEIAYQLGDLYDKAGETERALGEFERALAAKATPHSRLELRFRAGMCREQLGNLDAAVKDYERVIASFPADDVFRLSSLARCAALYERREDYQRALTVYRDLAKHASDPALVVAATERVKQLEEIVQ
jgi:TolA-binding protein